MELSVDLRVEHALRNELLKAKAKFRAKAASGLVSNVKTGEGVLWRWCRCRISIPTIRKRRTIPDRIDRPLPAYEEMGSTFKAFTLAMTSIPGRYDLNSLWDARGPLHFGKFAESMTMSRRAATSI